MWTICSLIDHQGIIQIALTRSLGEKKGMELRIMDEQYKVIKALIWLPSSSVCRVLYDMHIQLVSLVNLHFFCSFKKWTIQIWEMHIIRYAAWKYNTTHFQLSHHQHWHRLKPVLWQSLRPPRYSLCSYNKIWKIFISINEDKKRYICIIDTGLIWKLNTKLMQ